MSAETERWASESELQGACFMWAWNQYPQLRRLFFKVDNGASKNVVRAMRDRSEGVVGGIPDLVFVWPKPFGIEFKLPGKKQSRDQRRVEEVWKDAGIGYWVVTGLAEFKAVVEKHIQEQKM